MGDTPRDVSEQVLAHVLTVVSDAVLTIDHLGTVQSVNRGAVLLLGDRAERAVGCPAREVFSSPDEGAVEGLVAGSQTFMPALTLDGRPGQQLTVDVHILIEPHGRVLVLRDLTEQREAQQVLADIHDQQRSLERLGQVGRWELDRAHGELQWTEQVVEILGIDPLEMLGTLDELIELVRPDHREEFAEAIGAAGPSVELDEEVPVIRRDGSEAWVKIRAVAALGDPTVLHGVVQDVTGLRDALETARRVNNDVVRFAGVIAHDLRSPVATIAGMARLLSSTRLSVDDRAVLEERILSNSLVACEQIELLLGEALRTTSQLDPVPMRDVISWVRNLVAPQLEDVGMTLEWGDDLPTVHGRVPLLRQCVLNLVGNAIKYGQHDGGVVLVRSRTLSDTWEIAVEDDGAGIPVQDREQIFEPGVRLDGSGPELGSGLGLDAVRRVMLGMGGSVRAESSETLGGAAMILVFPHADPSRDQSVVEMAESDQAGAPT